ncbi:TetR/AcrR family transcriptional regulator [Amphibiibacter pelophylacis]|uniref:TetR/AcrR family transcriptional regulator n=1 Tax=Amphibiibacter pelophylacis TaxID=1799477 RepID=A0ACC6P3S9_9BURK
MTPTTPPRPTRDDREALIVDSATQHFALQGFEGASLDRIAEGAGMSRHRLFYYFPSKEALYLRVLDDIVSQWLDNMVALSAADDPQQGLRTYIEAKMRHSMEHPYGSRVYARELLSGASRYREVIVERVGPVLQHDLATLQKWAAQGRIAAVDFTHLMFVLWSATQAYADAAPQYALLLGKPALEAADFDAAAALITQMVLELLQPR